MKKQLNKMAIKTDKIVSLTTVKAQSVRGGLSNPLNPVNLFHPTNP